jgi:hypothetical protein
LRTTEVERGQRAQRQRAAVEVRDLLARLYRSFVLWGSLYGDLDRQDEQVRERIDRLSGDFTGHYLSRSVWFEQGTCKKIEKFIEKSKELYSEFSADIRERDYARARADIANRVSKELGRFKKEADAALHVELAETHQPKWRRRRLR